MVPLLLPVALGYGIDPVHLGNQLKACGIDLSWEGI